MNLEELFESNPELKEAYDKSLEERATAKAQEATSGLIKKRDELLAEKKAKQAELEEFKSKYDPDKYQEALDLLKKKEEAEMTLEQRAAKREQELLDNFKARETELLKKNETSLADLQKQIQAKDSSLRTYLVENELQRAIGAADGIPELLVPALKDKIKVVEDNGKYVARVFDGDTPRIGDSEGNYMTIGQLIDEVKSNPIFGGAFKASGATGGGANGTNSTTPNPSGQKTRSSMSFKERSAYISEHGQAKYFELPE